MASLGGFAQTHLRIVVTSDVHGNYLPYDFINRQPWGGGLSRVATYVDRQRAALGDESILLLDNGDILQGQPTAYYYNFIDTTSIHCCAAALNYLRYDAGVVGNHDVETGHAVYDRWVRECAHPVLCANAIDTRTNGLYWKPYVIFQRKGVRIAVFGLLTPAIPQWLPETLWAGLRFEDMVETARRWMPVLREEEKADVVIGVFHSGVGSLEGGHLRENASLQVVREVPGFDVVICGHDHRLANRRVLNVAGDSVLVLNPAANAFYVAEADLTIERGECRTEGRLVNIETLPPHPDYMAHFASQFTAVQRFTNEEIGTFAAPLETRSAYFGSSAFIDFIHSMQLELSHADISFAAPLSFDARIEAGPIRVSDMFNLYKFENLLYVMELTGQEIKDYLEFSYDGWVNTMQTPSDPMLRFRPNPTAIADGWQRLVTPSYNFDSAAGLYYTVDLRATRGNRIHIASLADGRPFNPDARYRVAVNSYRGNGGGHLLTEGAGIDKYELSKRIVWSTDKDLRYYLMQAIRSRGRLDPNPLRQWRFVPEEWVKEARPRDEKILFGASVAQPK